MNLPEARQIAETLRSMSGPWAIAGGWALDLALGRATRAHADIDIAVFREDQTALRSALADWRFEFVRGGSFVPWAAGAWLELPVHELHGHPPESALCRSLEFLLNEREGSDWAYRRDRAVRLPLRRALRDLGNGIHVLAPEIVLLYKSKAPRPVDELDFHAALPFLDAETRGWLRTAIGRTSPGHAWVASLLPDR
jgi:hypothetical protein